VEPAGRRVIARIVGCIVDFARRNAAAIAIAGLVVSLGGGFYAATHLALDTDLDHMLPADVAWRRNEIALDRAFPQNNNLLVIVVDGETGDVADGAARRLAGGQKLLPIVLAICRKPAIVALFC